MCVDLSDYNSAAFDTVDHDILLSILANRFSIQGLALDWFRSYLANRTQTFALAGKQTVSYSVDCSVPQGSVLGPLGFISYTEDIVDVIERHSVLPHIYADDTAACKCQAGRQFQTLTTFE